MRTFTVVLTIGLLRYFGIWSELSDILYIGISLGICLTIVQDIFELFRK